MGQKLLHEVLIVPLWNWNIVITLIPFLLTLSSNRTFMELKFIELLAAHTLLVVLIVPLWNWNPRPYISPLILQFVLIVPLWNWNKVKEAEIAQYAASSNRTFMELKYLPEPHCSNGMRCSNRTFMELKSQRNLFPFLQGFGSNRTFMELK